MNLRVRSARLVVSVLCISGALFLSESGTFAAQHSHAVLAPTPTAKTISGASSNPGLGSPTPTTKNPSPGSSNPGVGSSNPGVGQLSNSGGGAGSPSVPDAPLIPLGFSAIAAGLVLRRSRR
jgi:hypothetical protein